MHRNTVPGIRRSDGGQPPTNRALRTGRHAAPGRPISRRWRLAAVLGASPLLVAGVAAAAAPAINPVHYKVASAVTVQALGLDVAAPAVGQTVHAGAKVVAERQQTFDYVVIAVRDSAGNVVDFPGTASWTLGTTQKVYESSRSFAKAGTYTYWFAYEQGGKWTNLTPKATFTVGGSATTPSPSATGSTPTPSPSATSTAPTASAPATSTGPTASPSATSTATSPSPTTAPSSSPSTTATAPATGTQPLGVGGSWRYTFGDEFNGPIAWGTTWADTSTAEADNGHGNMGNQQLEWNSRANCSTANGTLTITAKPDSITSPSGQHYNWSSCLLSSSPSYAFRYGYIEMRAQLPGPKGFWPAFWTWQAAGNNQWTETDVFEFYSDNHSRLYLTQHSGAGGAFPYAPAFDPTTGYHTYGADIEADGTRFYVDGKLVYTAPGVSTGLTNIIVDNFVYSQIPPAAGTTGMMNIDYVRAWQH
jgi:beta-glucanase (GH16 family)